MRIGKSTPRLRGFLLALTFALISALGVRAQGIVVSIPPQQEIIEALCDVQPEILIGPGQSPETWSPSPRTMARIVSSKLYIPIGLPFETSLRKRIKDIAPGLKICTEAVPASKADTLDPHVWLDPEGALAHARAIANCLKSLPEYEATGINTRLQGYTEQLLLSERQATKLLSAYRGREFLVYHPAFGHFSQRFHLRQLAIEKDGKSPSARWMSTVMTRAQKLRIRTVFVQPSFASNAVDSISEALGANVVELDPLAEDLSRNIVRIAQRIADSFEAPSRKGRP